VSRTNSMSADFSLLDRNIGKKRRRRRRREDKKERDEEEERRGRARGRKGKGEGGREIGTKDKRD
jgi:hypothetical protein